ncbi:MAG: FkbM family methyltransferase [Candidatus Moranbacteria bacterium]|nr:FkbM family methyltransferase [Candidatus Moranbacteria bacterium]
MSLIFAFFENISFEIMEETFHILKDNVAHESRVKMHHVGFSDQSQELEMREYAGSSGHASCYDAQAGQPSRIVKCRVMKGDDFLEENGIDRVDIIKIDTEGHEFAVTKGFERAIKAGRVDVIQFEYGRVNVVSRALLYDFYQFFEKYGYVVGKIFPKFVRFKDYDFFDDNFIGPNFVAVRKRRTDIINAVI